MEQQKAPYRKFNVPLPLFKTGVIVIITTDTKRAAGYIKKLYNYPYEEWDATKLQGRTLARDGYWPIIWLREPPTQPDGQAILLHEITHVTYEILSFRGIPLDAPSVETYAYLGEHLYREIANRSTVKV